MLKWAAIFAVIALIALMLGAVGVFQLAAGIAQFLLILFLIVTLLLLVGGYLAYKKTRSIFR